ncbi:MAG: hypothetical protein R2715_11135 [Ilumatobacteraceae bacterium]
MEYGIGLVFGSPTSYRFDFPLGFDYFYGGFVADDYESFSQYRQIRRLCYYNDFCLDLGSNPGSRSCSSAGTTSDRAPVQSSAPQRVWPRRLVLVIRRFGLVPTVQPLRRSRAW